MIKYWGQKGVKIVPIVFQPEAAVYEKKGILPLSWHLRDEDKQLIEEAWNFELKKSNCQTVTDFVGTP